MRKSNRPQSSAFWYGNSSKKWYANRRRNERWRRSLRPADHSSTAFSIRRIQRCPSRPFRERHACWESSWCLKSGTNVPFAAHERRWPFGIWMQAWVKRQRSWAEVRWTEDVGSIRVQQSLPDLSLKPFFVIRGNFVRNSSPETPKFPPSPSGRAVEFDAIGTAPY